MLTRNRVAFLIMSLSFLSGCKQYLNPDVHTAQEQNISEILGPTAKIKLEIGMAPSEALDQAVAPLDIGGLLGPVGGGGGFLPPPLMPIPPQVVVEEEIVINGETIFVCGNGKLDKKEECDDNNLVNGDGCNEFCIIEACGNRILEVGEACEDGNTLDGDGCSFVCLIEESSAPTAGSCGNSIIEPGELCDDGNLINTDSCTNLCLPAACGDGFVQGAEECDDGNTINIDFCTAACTLAFCGDGFVQPGEGCDIVPVNLTLCSSTCALPSCGDGVVQAPELCDDGNFINNDACSNTCTNGCGDGITQTGEVCDDGNNSNTDFCTTDCLAASCGDGFIQPVNGEECDITVPPFVIGASCNAACGLIETACNDGLDNDDDGLIDAADIDCMPFAFMTEGLFPSNFSLVSSPDCSSELGPIGVADCLCTREALLSSIPDISDPAKTWQALIAISSTNSEDGIPGKDGQKSACPQLIAGSDKGISTASPPKIFVKKVNYFANLSLMLTLCPPKIGERALAIKHL